MLIILVFYFTLKLVMSLLDAMISLVLLPLTITKRLIFYFITPVRDQGVKLSKSTYSKIQPKLDPLLQKASETKEDLKEKGKQSLSIVTKLAIQ